MSPRVSGSSPSLSWSCAKALVAKRPPPVRVAAPPASTPVFRSDRRFRARVDELIGLFMGASYLWDMGYVRVEDRGSRCSCCQGIVSFPSDPCHSISGREGRKNMRGSRGETSAMIVAELSLMQESSLDQKRMVPSLRHLRQRGMHPASLLSQAVSCVGK